MPDQQPERPYRYVGFREDKAGQLLAPFLSVRPPNDDPDIDRQALSKAPPVLSFQRKREVDLPWRKMFQGVEIGTGPSLAGVRRSFERGWPLPARPTDADHARLVEAGWIRHIAAKPGEDRSAIAPVHRVGIDEEKREAKAVVVTEGIVLRHATGRLYLVIAAGDPLTLDPFKTRDGYLGAWTQGIEGVELVFAAPEEAKTLHTGFAEVDLRPAVIQRKFVELLEERKLADRIGAHVEDLTESVVKRIVATRFESGEVDAAHNRLLQIKVNRFDIERRIDRLVGAAAALGYYLFKDGGTFQFPDKSRTVAPGQIYTKFKRTAFWSTSHTRTESYRQRVLFWHETRERTVTETRQHSEVVADYQIVDTSVDLAGLRADAYRNAGMAVHICARGPHGFVSQEDGQPLRAIMQRCEIDESVRRRSVVFLPVYEERLTGERALVKYSIFERPLPGLLAVDLPRLSVVEQLSYRTVWRSMQLGELISSINLAPGETRTVTVSKEFRKETTVSRSSTSIFEINESESNDLATEMENQVSQESETAAYVDTDVTVKGSFVVSAEANVKAGMSQSMNQASQAISRVAKKAAHAINRQQREEVTSASSSKTSVTTRDQTTATLRNINDGRSLNLMFYRVYNRHDSGLFLDDLKLDVIPGVEVIAGSGVHESVTVPLPDLDRLVAELDVSQLPFQLGEADTHRYHQRVIESIESLLDTEYASSDRARQPANRSSGRESDDSPLSVGLLRLPPRGDAQPSRMGTAEASEIEDLERRLKERKAEQKAILEAEIGFKKALLTMRDRFARKGILSEEPRGEQSLLIASGGLYLDSLVGAQPSTEPYSEAMREQDVRMREAEVFARESDGIFQRAQASRLVSARHASDGNGLLGMMPSRDLTRLTLATRAPLGAGQWRLYLDGAALDPASLDIGGNEIVAVFGAPQPWLMEPGLHARLELVDSETRARLGYS